MNDQRAIMFSEEYAEQFRINLIIGLIAGLFAVVVVGYSGRLLAISVFLSIVFAIFIVAACRAQLNVRRFAGVVFVGGVTGLGIIYAVFGTYADSNGESASVVDGGIIFRADEGIVISGPISSRSPGEWTQVYTSEARAQLLPVYLNSRGGSVEAARIIAADIKKNQMQVLVAADAICESACTILFAAGSQRLADPKAHFMFHSSRSLLEMPHLPPIYSLKPNDPDQLAALDAFPVLREKLAKLGGWTTVEGVSGSAQRLHDNQDPSFLTLREIGETPSRRTK